MAQESQGSCWHLCNPLESSLMVWGWILLKVGGRKKGRTSHTCPLYPKVKAFPEPQKSSPHISLDRADHMTDHMPVSAAEDAGASGTTIVHVRPPQLQFNLWEWGQSSNPDSNTSLCGTVGESPHVPEISRLIFLTALHFHFALGPIKS